MPALLPRDTRTGRVSQELKEMGWFVLWVVAVVLVLVFLAGAQRVSQPEVQSRDCGTAK